MGEKIIKTTKTETHKSHLDQSVNFVMTGDYPGKMEARYVRRKDYYVACYLSSQTGCNQACKMCHLTATKQFQMVDVDIYGYLQQARAVLDYYEEKTPAKVIHYNFMSRGEALNNRFLIEENDYSILEALAKLSWDKYKLHPRFNISTIMPKQFQKNLLDCFPIIYPDFYYSIYSVNPEFRKVWLRNAQPTEEALEKFCEWQEVTKKIVKLHFALIEGQNDSEKDITNLCTTVIASGLKVDFNIVRYNPYSEKYGKESSEEVFNNTIQLMKQLLPSNTKIDIIPRVGYDVNASCGTFYC